jgi:hypothetical protein
MKKLFRISVAALALILLSAACAKVNPVDETPFSKTITIRATISDAATRVTFDPSFDGNSNPTAMAHTWQSSDKLRITDASDASKTALFDLVDGAGTATGTFEGTGFEAASYNVEAVPQGSFSSGFTQTQAKDGATDHLQFVATATGVTDLENFSLTETSGIVGVIAKLPDDVAATINALEIEAKVAGLPTSIKVTVNLTAQEDVDSDDILKIYANAPTGFAIPAGAEVFLRFKSTNAAHTVYTRYQKFDTALLPVQGKFNYVKFNCSHIDQSAGANDDGTSTDPYLIADKYQMLAMRAQMKKDQTTSFSLVADIDLEDEVWTPLNYDDGFARGLDFEGNGHTISNLTSTDAQNYPSFVGVVNGSVKNLVFDGATITGGGNVAGVLAGYVGSGTAIFGNISGITVKNSTVSGSKQRLGGIAGYVKNISGTIDDCHVINTTVESAADRVGGLFGQFDKLSYGALNCTAENVTVSGTINIGGLVGVGYGYFTDCTSSGTVSSTNTTSNADIALGGLVGYFENGVISHCSSSVNINQTTNGRDLGGLVGKMLAGTVEKSFATGNVKGLQRNVGGLIGLITNTSGISKVSNCYCTGSVVANAYSGGFLGLFEKGKAEIANCYATGNVEGTAFGIGGLIGFIGGADFTMNNSAAWNGSIVPANYGEANWSSGAVAAVTFPTCTLTDNYRSPSMSLTAFWVPAADYDHPNVSSTAPLVVKDITTGELRPTTATGTGGGNDNYPQFPYHGKHVAVGTSLSTLASTTLGWSSAVWDFSGDVPTLK